MGELRGRFRSEEASRFGLFQPSKDLAQCRAAIHNNPRDLTCFKLERALVEGGDGWGSPHVSIVY